MKQKIPIVIMMLGAFIVIIAIGVISVLSMSNRYDEVTISSGVVSSVSENTAASGEDNTSSVMITSSSGNTQTQDSAHQIKVSGDLDIKERDVLLYVKRMYELKYLFGVTAFDSPSKIQTDVMVQYAFCHLFYDSLVDMPKPTKMIYRQAVESSVHEEIKRQFNINGVDIKSSDLYNTQKKIFEMWQPDYRREVYADSSCKKLSAGTYQLTVTFYTDAKKSTVKDVLVGKIEKNGEYFSIIQMNSK